MKRVLVTGATRGLGFAVATRLAEDGYHVFASGRQQTDALDALMSRYPGQVQFCPSDLHDTAGIQTFVRNITKAHGPLFGLVNNAGIGLDGVLSTMHNSDVERILRVNTLAPLILAKYVSRSMMLNGCGRIVNVSSIIASTGFSGLVAYAASKAALEGMTRSLARELGRLNITVNAVAPGYMETEMTQGISGEKLRTILKRSPLGKLARPEDVAGAVAYLFGADGSSVTGTVMTVDAGSTS